MSIHSKILVHWTGKKDIEHEQENTIPKLYLERLIDYYQNGLFTKIVTETPIRIRNAIKNTIEKVKIKNLIRICFTEIRLSHAQIHAGRYGKLGIGFSRDFILNKGGRPVIYIPFKTRPEGRLFENSIYNIYKKSKDNSDIHRSSKWIMAHVKLMSNGKNENSKDYEDFYEEMEWRLVRHGSYNQKCFVKGEGSGVYRLKFKPNDIKILIFRDEDTKQMALKDETIRKYFSEHMPNIVTLDDCENY